MLLKNGGALQSCCSRKRLALRAEILRAAAPESPFFPLHGVSIRASAHLARPKKALQNVQMRFYSNTILIFETNIQQDTTCQISNKE